MLDERQEEASISTERIVYLARHGETDWNKQNRWQGQTDIALNDAGRAQAAELAEKALAFGLGRVAASDLVRARETGEIVAARVGAPFHGVDPRLRERSFGLFEGLTREECLKNHPEHWQRYLGDPELLPPGAEERLSVAERMFAGVDALARLVDAPLLIVAHGSCIRALVDAVSGKRTPPVVNCAVFRMVLREHDDLRGRFVSAESLLPRST